MFLIKLFCFIDMVRGPTRTTRHTTLFTYTTLVRSTRQTRRATRDYGGWPRFHDGDMDLGASVKAYFALKLAGDDPEAAHMERARAAILAAGGAAQSNVFTRIALALFGQVPWRAVPEMPVEIMLLPRWFPLDRKSVV